MDSPGNNEGQITGSTAQALAVTCNLIPNCQGFDTQGERAWGFEHGA